MSRCIPNGGQYLMEDRMSEDKLMQIAPEDLAAIKAAKTTAAVMRALADKAESDRKVAELEAKNLILLTYVKYGLTSNDSINPEDGTIVRNPVQPPLPQMAESLPESEQEAGPCSDEG